MTRCKALSSSTMVQAKELVVRGEMRICMYAFSRKPTARQTAALVRLVRQRGLGRGARIRQQLLGGVGGGGGRRQRACRPLGASPSRALS